jgi:hypothetical protein
MDEWIKKKILVYTHNGILFSLKEEGNTVISTNMDRTGGHYVRENKPGMRRQKLNVLTHVGSKKFNLIEVEHRMWLPETGERGWREVSQQVPNYS